MQRWAGAAWKNWFSKRSSEVQRLAKGLEKSKQIIRPHGDNLKTSDVYVITINSVLLQEEKKKTLVSLLSYCFCFCKERKLRLY